MGFHTKAILKQQDQLSSSWCFCNHLKGLLRLRGIIVVTNDGNNGDTGVLELTTTSNTGTTLFIADCPTMEM